VATATSNKIPKMMSQRIASNSPKKLASSVASVTHSEPRWLTSGEEKRISRDPVAASVTGTFLARAKLCNMLGVAIFLKGMSLRPLLSRNQVMRLPKRKAGPAQRKRDWLSGQTRNQAARVPVSNAGATVSPEDVVDVAAVLDADVAAVVDVVTAEADVTAVVDVVTAEADVTAVVDVVTAEVDVTAVADVEAVANVAAVADVGAVVDVVDVAAAVAGVAAVVVAGAAARGEHNMSLLMMMHLSS